MPYCAKVIRSCSISNYYQILKICFLDNIKIIPIRESLFCCHLLHTSGDTLQLEKHTFEKLGNITQQRYVIVHPKKK